jgi:hypothetical protein
MAVIDLFSFTVVHQTSVLPSIIIDKESNYHSQGESLVNQLLGPGPKKLNNVWFLFHVVEKRCEPNPCQNGGFCHESFTTGDYRCECPKPYKGTNCEGE